MGSGKAGVYVRQVDPKGGAARSGRVKRGARLVSVDGVTLDGKGISAVRSLIQGMMSVTACRHRPLVSQRFSFVPPPALFSGLYLSRSED